MFLFVTDCCDRILNKLEKLSQQNNHFVKISIILFISFNLIYFPEFIRKNFSKDWTVADLGIQEFLNEKIKEPFKPFTAAHEADHLRKRDLRITPYVIGYALHLDAAKLFYIQILLLAALIYVTLRLIQQQTNDGVIAILGTICLLFCYVGNSFTFDTLFLDSYAYLGMVLALYICRNLICIPILLTSYFVDERSLVPSLIIPLFSYLQNYPAGEKLYAFSETFDKMIIRNKAFWYVFVAIILYVLIRFGFYQFLDLRTPVGSENGVQFGIAFSYGDRVLPAFWSALKSNMFLILLGIIYLHKKKQYITEAWITAALLLTVGIALSVEDITRSFAYSFPIIFLVYQIIGQNADSRITVRRFMLAFACINIFTPTYTLILDLTRIKSFSWLF